MSARTVIEAYRELVEAGYRTGHLVLIVLLPCWGPAPLDLLWN